MKKKSGERSLGTVLHILDNKLIFKCGKLNVKRIVGSIVVTEGKRKIGKVYDIFGPVNRPYVGIKVFEGISGEELEELAYKKLYVV